MEEVLKLYIFPNMRDRRSSIFFPAAPLVVAHENMLHTRGRGGGGFHATAAMPEVISSSQHLKTFFRAGVACVSVEHIRFSSP